MGQKKSDGKASVGGVTWPDSEEILFGDFYRLDNWNVIALGACAATDTGADRIFGVEFSSEHIWYVKAPAALNATKGQYLYWTDVTGFQRGDTDLTATGGGTAPCAIVEEAQDAGDYVGIRVLNVGPSGATT